MRCLYSPRPSRCSTISASVSATALTIDGKELEKGAVQGRYDVLVSLDATPLILAELKAPGVDIAEDDVAQALSYARVHQPIVSLVLVTNGKKIRLLRTYDGSDLSPDDVEGARLKKVLETAAALAASATEDAIRTLLGTSGRIWGQLFKAWNEESISAMTGGVREFSRPIVRELAVPRHVVKQVEDHLARGARVVVLHGPPLVGITNVLSQFARSIPSAPVLLIDAIAAPDALQYIANRLSRELAVGVSKDDVRSWLNTRKGLLDITLAIDGFPKDGVEELVDFANAGLLRLVLGMGSDVYYRSSALAGRIQQSLLGRSAFEVQVQPLSDDEFCLACDQLATSFGAYFLNGAQHVSALRFPRRLRTIAGTLPGVVAPVPAGTTPETFVMIPPIPGPEMVETYGRSLAPEPALKHDLRKLAAAFLADVSQHVDNPDWMAATWGRPSIDPDIIEDVLGDPRVRRLCELGFLSWTDTPGLGPRILIRIEELLTQDVSVMWARGLEPLEDPDAITLEVGKLLKLMMIVPDGEVALASAIIQGSRRNSRILGSAIPYLMEQKPGLSKVKEGARVDLLLKDARIRLNFGNGMEEQAIGNIGPWVVLSHLAILPMAVEGFDVSANLQIFMRLGVAPHLIIIPRPIEPEIAAGFHFHEFEGVGQVLCQNTGIVEPLVQAMIAHAHRSPQEFKLLGEKAIEQKDLHLGWRVLSAAMGLRGSVEEDIANAAEAVESALGDWWKQFLRATAEEHADSRDQSTELPAPEPHRNRSGKRSLPTARPTAIPWQASVKMGRNAPCPCGSGKKFKKCHGKP